MRIRHAALIVGLLALAACGGNKARNDGPPSGSARIPDLPGDAVPRKEPRSKYGNGPVYEVLGKRYRDETGCLAGTDVVDGARGHNLHVVVVSEKQGRSIGRFLGYGVQRSGSRRRVFVGAFPI